MPDAAPSVRMVSGTQDRRGSIDDTGLPIIVKFVRASDASYETPLIWIVLSKADISLQSYYSQQKKARREVL